MAPKKGLNESEEKLLDVILNGTAEEVRALLKEPNVRVDCLDQTGMTPLQHAAFKGRKNMCEVFLSHGADVNSNHHDQGYSALMFAALSGNSGVTQLMLQSGAKTGHINSVNRNASQMAAFVGQHQCVAVINNFFPKEDLDYFTVCQGLEKEPKLPAHLAPSLLLLINFSNMHPVKISLFVQEHLELLRDSYKVCKVLNILVQRSMKSRETNDILAIKTHYLSSVIKHMAKAVEERNGETQPWIKSLLKGRESDGFPEKQDRLIRQALKEFPYLESQLLHQVVRQLAPVKVGDNPTALFMLMQCINGQQTGFDEDKSCGTCGNSTAEKRCSVCKMVGYCDQACQKMHWFTHKKFCKQLAVEFAEMETMREEREAIEKTREEEKKQKELEEKEKKEKEMEGQAAIQTEGGEVTNKEAEQTSLGENNENDAKDESIVDDTVLTSKLKETIITDCKLEVDNEKKDDTSQMGNNGSTNEGDKSTTKNQS